MSKITIIDNEFITMWYYPVEKIVHHQFHKKTIYGQVFRDALNTGIKIQKENNACKWLSDDRTNVVFAQDDMNWGTMEWTPNALEHGWKYWAIVKPLDSVGKMMSEQIAYGHKKLGLTVEYFKDVEKAFEWLCNCK